MAAMTLVLEERRAPRLSAARLRAQPVIDWLVEEMKTQGWSRLYWHTKENNYRARGLYDKYASHSGFVRYALHNPPER